MKNNFLYQVADHVIARAGEGLSQAKKADRRSVVDLGCVWGGYTPQALVNRGAWGGCKNDIYPNSNQHMLRNSVAYH